MSKYKHKRDDSTTSTFPDELLVRRSPVDTTPQETDESFFAHQNTVQRNASLDGLFDYDDSSAYPAEPATSWWLGFVHFVVSIPQLVREPDFYIPAMLILGWYVFSLAISIYNKWMFGPHLNFHFPVLITAFHQLILFGISFVCLALFPGLVPKSQTQYTELGAQSFLRKLYMSPAYYVTQIAPCCLASAGDIGFSNASFRYVTLTLYTMLKTSSLAFVLLFGLLFKLEKFNWRLIVIVLVMTGSVMMMVAGTSHETSPSTVAKRTASGQNSPLGVALVLSAAVMLGVRWSFTQILLKRNAYTSNPILTIFYLLPGMAFVLACFGLGLEGWSKFVTASIWAEKGIPMTLGLMVIPGVLAFSMTVCEFQLLHRTRVVTLSVAGIFKELLTIVVSTAVFGDELNFVNVVGLVITLGDICWYNYYRFSENTAEKQTDAEDLFEHIEDEDFELNSF
ncbi:hypothetical protein BABINDRAFT_161120 [Babjeviella inositovora NRRL Y-12698]|uniref:Sugar phosphate transporter domain-containing protein n=1 Tax=Babjeviella inositovora NRRL Y-12698 TaxID=984486 RepID=A0A1E3QR17_9ASCO|nr:uncharacterized protein BABINDRAFT_161120 [Babjeviella inositovora NRRL Y-12698]ODQ80135.1 hypothetical protein BABINDRAFT_161120 [Babjeviella inositovora NRRL Y-12698]